MTKLVSGHPDRLPGFVAQADDALPGLELLDEGAVRIGFAAVAVFDHAGEQPRAAAWPDAEHVLLLGADRSRGLGVERDQLLGADLGGLEPQVKAASATLLLE